MGGLAGGAAHSHRPQAAGAADAGELVLAIVGVGDHDGGGSGSFYLPGGDVTSGIVSVVLGTFNHGRTR